MTTTYAHRPKAAERRTDRLAQLSNVHLDMPALREAFTKPTPKRSADWAVLAERMWLHEPEPLSDGTPKVNQLRKPAEGKVWAGGLLNDTWDIHAPPSPKDWCWTECESELDHGHCGIPDWWTEKIIEEALKDNPFSGPVSAMLPWWGKDDVKFTGKCANRIEFPGALADAEAWATETASKAHFPGEREDTAAFALLAMTEALQDPSLTREYGIKGRIATRMLDTDPRHDVTPPILDGPIVKSANKSVARKSQLREKLRHWSEEYGWHREIPIAAAWKYLGAEDEDIPRGEGWASVVCLNPVHPEVSSKKRKKTGRVNLALNAYKCFDNEHDGCDWSADSATKLLMLADPDLDYDSAVRLSVYLAQQDTEDDDYIDVTSYDQSLGEDADGYAKNGFWDLCSEDGWHRTSLGGNPEESYFRKLRQAEVRDAVREYAKVWPDAEQFYLYFFCKLDIEETCEVVNGQPVTVRKLIDNSERFRRVARQMGYNRMALSRRWAEMKAALVTYLTITP